MKHYSESFNKQTRLIDTPTVSGDSHAFDGNFAPADLEQRIVTALRIQHDVFPCFDWVFPPPILGKSGPPQSPESLFASDSVHPGLFSVYLHIPFCKTLCSFCYYRVIPGRGTQETSAYTETLIREIAMYKKALNGQKCESVYLGGGTPTYLSNHELGLIFEALRKAFDITEDAEITIESAPDTIPRDKLLFLRGQGVNRLSYGIQTLDEQLLATMNRYYVVTQAMKEIEGAIDVIGNVNIDTMYGFDGEPDGALLETLEAFVRMGVPCLTTYKLDSQRNVKKKIWTGPPKDALFRKGIELYRQAEVFLQQHGYEQLFQNTHALPGRGSYRHQLRRWENVPLVALGIGSMGYAPRTPYQNVGGIKPYSERIREGRLPIETTESLSPEMELCRQLCTQLRFASADLDELHHLYGVRVEAVFSDLIEVLRRLGFLTRDGRQLRMTTTAMPYNNVIPLLFAPDTFKAQLLSLPEEYLATMPTPYALTHVGPTQSGTLEVPCDTVA